MKKIILLVLIVIFYSNISYAAIFIDIDVKSTFIKNDNLGFTYKLYSDQEVNIKYTATIQCEKNPLPLRFFLQP